MNNYIITGASSGLGFELAKRLRREALTFTVGGPAGYFPSSPVDMRADLSDSAALPLVVESAMAKLKSGKPATQNILINCAGLNYIEAFDETNFAEWDQLMALNARAPIELTQHLLPWLTGSEQPGTVVNIISNASHVPMTNSVCYNASKGALHIATLAMGREIGKSHGITVFGVSPNKMEGTEMSEYIESRVPELRGWTPEEAARYQTAALPAGAATPPWVVAEFIAFLLSKPERHRYLHQTVIPYGG